MLALAHGVLWLGDFGVALECAGLLPFPLRAPVVAPAFALETFDMVD